MDKFQIFRELLDFVAARAKVTDADMNVYGYKDGVMKVVGEVEGEEITIEVTIEKKEEKEDA